MNILPIWPHQAGPSGLPAVSRQQLAQYLPDKGDGIMPSAIFTNRTDRPDRVTPQSWN